MPLLRLLLRLLLLLLLLLRLFGFPSVAADIAPLPQVGEGL